MRTNVAVIVCSLVVSQTVLRDCTLGQERQRIPVLSKVASAVQEFVDNGEVAGIVTLVADHKGIRHLHAAGMADLVGQTPMTTDSIFWIASMSKPVTGACVMMLVDEGKLSLGDPIAKHLPDLKRLRMADGKPVDITVKHLLTHTSGMAELKTDEAYTAKTLEEAAARYAKVEVLFEPGSKWQYSQTSINTAARIVEVVSGKSFDEFLQERLCRPLGMDDTTFYLSAKQSSRLAKSYRKGTEGKLEETEIRLLAGKAPTDRERFPAANGGLFSTAEDYGRFCRMLLGGGELNGKRVLSAAAVKTMQTIATGDLKTGFTDGNGWGIGCCVVREPQGVTQNLSAGSFGHGGAYGTQAWIDPVKNRIYILMIQRANLPNADGSQIRKAFQEQASASNQVYPGRDN